MREIRTSREFPAEDAAYPREILQALTQTQKSIENNVLYAGSAMLTVSGNSRQMPALAHSSRANGTPQSRPQTSYQETRENMIFPREIPAVMNGGIASDMYDAQIDEESWRFAEEGRNPEPWQETSVTNGVRTRVPVHVRVPVHEITNQVTQCEYGLMDGHDTSRKLEEVVRMAEDKRREPSVVHALREVQKPNLPKYYDSMQGTSRLSVQDWREKDSKMEVWREKDSKMADWRETDSKMEVWREQDSLVKSQEMKRYAEERTQATRELENVEKMSQIHPAKYQGVTQISQVDQAKYQGAMKMSQLRIGVEQADHTEDTHLGDLLLRKWRENSRQEQRAHADSEIERDLMV